MEILTGPYLQQLCWLLLWCCCSLLTSFFFPRKIFACHLVICRTSRTGIEKCAAKLFQIHGGSTNESSKLSLPGNTFLNLITAWALLLLCPHQSVKSRRGVHWLPPPSPQIASLHHRAVGIVQGDPGRVGHGLSTIPRERTSMGIRGPACPRHHTAYSRQTTPANHDEISTGLALRPCGPISLTKSAPLWLLIYTPCMSD